MQEAKITTLLITEKDIMNFLGILIISGYHTIPSEKQHWSTRPSLVAPIYPETMSRSRFLEIKKYVHLANNENLSNSKTAKVDLRYHKLLLIANNLEFSIRNFQLMKAWYLNRGKHPIKQFIRNKPVRFGYKIWFMCGTDGYPYNLQIYKDKETGPKREVSGPRVVEDMASTIRHEDADKHILYFDNFFTSHQLLNNIAKKNLRAIGTVRINRMMKCILNILKKDGRVSLDYISDENVLFA